MQWTTGGKVFEDITRTKNIQIPAASNRFHHSSFPYFGGGLLVWAPYNECREASHEMKGVSGRGLLSYASGWSVASHEMKG